MIRFSGFVEPLLDKKIYNHISLIKNMSLIRIEIVTNGDPLNKDRLIKLFKSGLDKILISVYDGRKNTKNLSKWSKLLN